MLPTEINDELLLDYEDFVVKLKQAVINEKCSPELLPYEDFLVVSLTETLENQEENLALINLDDPVALLRSQIGYIEVDRINYLLKSYMRTRMFKMESFPAFTIKSKKMRQRLSPDEFSYCKRYVDLVFGHFMQSFLSFLPERYQDIALSNDDIEMVPKPSLDRHVFVSFRERLEDLQISTDEYISVDAGDTYLLQYGLVKDVLLNGQLNLV